MNPQYPQRTVQNNYLTPVQNQPTGVTSQYIPQRSSTYQIAQPSSYEGTAARASTQKLDGYSYQVPTGTISTHQPNQIPSNIGNGKVILNAVRQLAKSPEKYGNTQSGSNGQVFSNAIRQVAKSPEKYTSNNTGSNGKVFSNAVRQLVNTPGRTSTTNPTTSAYVAGGMINRILSSPERRQTNYTPANNCKKFRFFLYK